MAHTPEFASHNAERRNPLPRIGGVLAIAGTVIGVGIFVLGCFGFSAAFYLAPLPLILGIVGFLMVMSGLFCSHITADDPYVVAAFLLNIAVIVGATLEIMIMMNVPMFAGK